MTLRGSVDILEVRALDDLRDTLCACARVLAASRHVTLQDTHVTARPSGVVLAGRAADLS